MGQVVLLTGVSRYLGARLAGILAADSNVERVIGIDTAPPGPDDLVRMGRTEFVRADIRNPLIAKVIAQAKVDTVVHTSVTATPRGAGGRTPMKELNVIGTMQLLAACQKSDTITRLVVKSSSSVYGSSPRDPAVFTERTAAKVIPRSGYAKDCVEVESYVRGFSRRRPDVGVSVLRFVNFIGPTIDTPITRYLALPVVPTSLGFDPRLQFIHEDDAMDVLRLAALTDRPGTFNVAGEGVMLLSQALRRAGRVAIPIPLPAVQLVGNLVRRSGAVDFSPEQMEFLSFGRVVDSAALHEQFGFVPRYSTSAAFDDFLTGRPVAPVVSRARIDRGEALLEALLPGRLREVVRHG